MKLGAAYIEGKDGAARDKKSHLDALYIQA
jgi:hypothetical protein